MVSIQRHFLCQEMLEGGGAKHPRNESIAASSSVRDEHLAKQVKKYNVGFTIHFPSAMCQSVRCTL